MKGFIPFAFSEAFSKQNFHKLRFMCHYNTKVALFIFKNLSISPFYKTTDMHYNNF